MRDYMQKYKIGVKWANGNYEGFIGKGRTLDLAIDDATRQVVNKATSLGVGFSIIKQEDVSGLVKSGQESIKKHWDMLSDDSEPIWWP
jgi:hypothetical protein